MKVLVLILSSNGEPLYLELQKIWRKYMHRSAIFECYFYTADNTLETEWKLDGDTLYVKCPDNLEHVSEKMRLAFKAFEHRLDEFNYIFRPNLSSFIVFERYAQFLEGVPKETHIVSVYHQRDWVSNGGTKWQAEQYQISGAGITMTPPIASAYIKYEHTSTMDDIDLQQMVQSSGMPIKYLLSPRIDILSPEHGSRLHYIKESSEIFHVRVKHESNRLLYDLDIQEKLYSMFYEQ
jgi:hypothetical protein